MTAKRTSWRFQLPPDPSDRSRSEWKSQVAEIWSCIKRSLARQRSDGVRVSSGKIRHGPAQVGCCRMHPRAALVKWFQSCKKCTFECQFCHASTLKPACCSGWWTVSEAASFFAHSGTDTEQSRNMRGIYLPFFCIPSNHNAMNHALSHVCSHTFFVHSHVCSHTFSCDLAKRTLTHPR